jgi:hypothetical protein
VETLARIYTEARALACYVVRGKLAKAGKWGDVDGISHDMAERLVSDFIRRNGFAVRNFRAYLSLKYSQGETNRAARRREGAEAGPVVESVPDARERADGCADALDPAHFIEEILDHPAGAYLVYFLAVGRSLRSALLEGEAAGVPRAWLRDNAPQVVGVWRTLHGGKAEGKDGRRDRRRPIRTIQEAVDYARGKSAGLGGSLDRVLLPPCGGSAKGGRD